MPELPEVETVARQLAPLLEGRILRKLEVLDPLLKADLRGAHGLKIYKVFRLGKQVVLQLGAKKPVFLAIHLRMTGRLIWTAAKAAAPVSAGRFLRSMKPKERAPRARLILDRGELCFFDVRRFGTICATQDLDSLRPRGIDPLTAELTKELLYDMLRRSPQALKQWLLRQDRLVGIGNIYACEILFAARLSPFRRANTLSRKQAERLFTGTRRILKNAIRHCGTTFSDFQDSKGELGGYQEFLKVYDREGEPCPSCGRKIVRQTQHGRGTFFCPRCQR